MEKIDKKAVLALLVDSSVCPANLIERINALPTSDGWVSVNTPPKESGRYWCNVKEVNDISTSHFQWNCYYDAKLNDWTDNFTPYSVTHWTNLLPTPPTK